MTRHALVFVTVLLLSSSTAVARGPFGAFSVGDWSAGAYTDESGDFSHCAASGVYKSGIVMIVGVDRAYGWTLGFSHQSWVLASGETIPIDLSFDNRGTFRVYGEAISLDGKRTTSFVKVPMPPNSRLVSEFRRSYVMQAFAKGHLYEFSLTSTSQLLPALTTCVASHNQTRFATTSTTSEEGGARIASRADTLEVATIYLGKSPITYRILQQDENPMKNFPVNWSYGQNSVGGMMLIYGDDLDGKKALSVLLKDQAGACLEKNATDVKPAQTSEGAIIYRAEGLCQMDGGTASTSYLVAETKTGLVLIAEMVDQTDAQTHPEMKQPEFNDGLLASFPAHPN